MLGRNEPEEKQVSEGAYDPEASRQPPIDQKPFLEAVWPVLACGAGLFSDGYVNNVIGSVTTVLKAEYGTVYTHSQPAKIVSAIVFAGTVVGQLVFGYTSDRWSRKNSLLIATIILIVFTALAAGSYYKGDPVAMFSMLAAWRFFVGIGIGGEYPAGSVSCAESTGELKGGSRNRWFILFTNTMIDFGFVVGAFVPYVVAAATHNGHYSTIWRTSLGIGVVFPLILFVLRLKLQEPEEFERNSLKNVRTPYWLVFKFYGPRLLTVSLIWFIYNFSSYAFGIFSAPILQSIYGDSTVLTTIFGWNTVINLFYIPGTLIGAPLSDKIGPRYTLIIGFVAQSVVGFIMAATYAKLSKVIGAFVVVYGLFLSLGELGPGNNIGLLAAKTCATGVRGQYYGIAAAIGKIGAFVGVYVFPYIQDAGMRSAGELGSYQFPFWVSSSLCLLGAALAFFFLPHIGQDTITQEDEKFREYLAANGWDVSKLGSKSEKSTDSF